MMPFAIAVKAFIVEDGKALLLRRRGTDVHKPNEWDIPGGRLQPAENPFEGLAREVAEETGLQIKIQRPLHVQHFTRDDGQVITMIIFLCRKTAGKVQLSAEHEEYSWRDIDDRSAFPAWLAPVLQNITAHHLA
jgi:8-oxo-dGTP diphosphatase